MNQLWAEKFGLKGNPFKDTIDTDLFFRTRQHEEALLKLKIGIEDKHALILLTGSSGTGKTLASQVALQGLDMARFEPVFVFVYPGMGKGALLGAILADLNIEGGRFVHQRLISLQEVALNIHEQGRRLVIIIDEAHFLKADALHILRTLSNIETEHEKLVSVLLVAEQSLRRRLRSPSYASLRGRITFSISLSPLSLEDLEQYVKFRLLKCGGQADLLDPDIYNLLYEATQGVPREVNRLLYNGFIDAASRGEHPAPRNFRNAVANMKGLHG
jgi:type II secretory pathway predicted ATPase ExeA